MNWKNLFNEQESQAAVSRINALTSETQPEWGKMSVAQMMAHCNVAYELVYTDKHPKPGSFQKFMIKLFAKNVVVGPKPYKRNARTAPMFMITDEREFETEKKRLVDHIQKPSNWELPILMVRNHMLLEHYRKMNGIRFSQNI